MHLVPESWMRAGSPDGPSTVNGCRGIFGTATPQEKPRAIPGCSVDGSATPQEHPRAISDCWVTVSCGPKGHGAARFRACSRSRWNASDLRPRQSCAFHLWADTEHWSFDPGSVGVDRLLRPVGLTSSPDCSSRSTQTSRARCTCQTSTPAVPFGSFRRWASSLVLWFLVDLLFQHGQFLSTVPSADTPRKRGVMDHRSRGRRRRAPLRHELARCGTHLAPVVWLQPDRSPVDIGR